MRDQEIVGLWEAYSQIYEEVDTRRAPKELVDRLNASREGHMAQDGPNKPAYDAKQRLLKKAKKRRNDVREESDLYDIILSQLLDEGYTEEESNQIMVLIIENQMNPQEVIGRGIANMLGFDRPNPSQVFGRAFKAAFMHKPKPVQAPKPPNPPKVSPVGKPPSGQKPPTTPPKPNPYRPGATVRATGPNMDKFPELQRFANQGTRPAPPPKPGQGFSIPGGRLGAFAAGIQAYNTADATPKTAPKFPTTAKEVKKGETYYDPSTRVGSSQRFAQREKVGPKIVGTGNVGTQAQSFDKAYSAAKTKGGMGSTFSWKGKSYKVA